MNRLATPVTLLAIVVIGLGVWFAWLWQHQSGTPAVVQMQSATSTATIATTVPAQAAATSTPALDPTAVAEDVVGSWQSTDDPNYSIKVTTGGVWTDSYEGADASNSISQTGTYELFTSQKPDKDFTGVLVPGVVYLKVSEGTDTNYFSVLEASGSNLQLSYLDRGTTLSFVKEQ